MTNKWVEPLSPFYPSNKSPKFKLLAEKILKQPELAADPRFSTNKARVVNRAEIVKIISDALMENERDHWLREFSGLGYFMKLIR